MKAKYLTMLVGYRARKYVIVERPTIGGMPARMEDGTAWAVNFVHDGSIYGFTAYILGSNNHPFPLAFLSYPESLDRTELRQSQRFPVHLSVSFAPEASAADPATNWEPGIIRDISEGGCLLLSTVAHEPGTLLILNLRLPIQGEIQGLVADIKSSRGQSGRHLLGLSFVDFGDDGYRKLTAYIESLRTMAIRV